MGPEDYRVKDLHDIARRLFTDIYRGRNLALTYCTVTTEKQGDRGMAL